MKQIFNKKDQLLVKNHDPFDPVDSSKNINYLNKNSQAVQAVATVVLVAIAVIALIQTNSILSQQKSEEFIRLRPYVSIINSEVYLAGVNTTPQYGLTLKFNNFGQTPANEFTWRIDFNIENIKDETPTPGAIATINPGQGMVVGLITILSTNQINSIITQNESGKIFKIKYFYKAYSGVCFYNEMQSNLVRTAKGYVLGSAGEDMEKIVNCNFQL